MIKKQLQCGAPQEYLRPKGIPAPRALPTAPPPGRSSQRGAAMLLFVLFFTFASTVMMLGLNQSIFTDMSDFNQLLRSKQAYLASESIVEDVAYRTMTDQTVNSTEALTIGGVTGYATSTYNTTLDQYDIVGAANFQSVIRKAVATLTVSAGTSFNYGLQSGTGGITLANNSNIVGNVYSNGPVTGAGSAEVRGDIVSAGPTGIVNTITATGSIYANTINRINAGQNASYNVQIGTNAQNPVAGIRYTPAANQPIASFPISSTTIQEWKDSITTTITAADPLCSSGTYTLNTNATIGYLKVECNLDIVKSGPSTTITLTGPVWVQGNLSFTSGPTIQVSSSLGRKSAQFIVDNPSNRTTSSRIEVRNSTQFNGSGDSRSFVLLLSMNESAALGGTQKAVDVSQSANGKVLAYSDRGLIDIGNGISLKEITGYKINVAQNSSVIYESGLSNLLFATGPGGSYSLEDWRQTQ